MEMKFRIAKTFILAYHFFSFYVRVNIFHTLQWVHLFHFSLVQLWYGIVFFSDDFFPSMSLYEWDHDAKIHIKNSHESLLTPFISSWSPFCPNSAHFFQKKSCAQTFMAFQIIFQFTVSKHQAAIIVANTWSKRMTWQFHDKKGLFCYLTNRFFYSKKGLHCKLFRKSEKRW